MAVQLYHYPHIRQILQSHLWTVLFGEGAIKIYNNFHLHDKQ